MSMTGPGIADLPLFAPPPGEPVESIHQAAEDQHAAFLERLRKLVAGHYAGSGTVISTDEVWKLMERYRIEFPAGASPNVLGSLFSQWDRATPVGWTRSAREGSHGNLLRTWIVT